MLNIIKSSWRLPILIAAIVCTAIIGFILVQSWVKGRIPNPQILELPLARELQAPQRASLQPQSDEPWHYDFFTLLEQPAPDRAVPELELAQNPAIKAKARHSLDKISGKFAIQVASLKNPADAQTLIRQLNAQGYHAVIINDSVKGESWYRIQIDGGLQRENAESLQANIQRNTGLKGFVVSL